MSAAPDILPQGAPFAIGEAVVAALRAAPDLAGVLVRDNPVRASDLADGERVVFYEDATDSFREQPGQLQKRVFTFTVGVIHRSDAPRLGAHRDYRAAKRAVRSALAGLPPTLRTGALTEGDVSYRLENIDVGGSLVLGSFSVEYRDPN
jgi:hypothetical protein